MNYIHQKYAAFRAWLAAHTHIHLRELSTKIGLLLTAISVSAPNFEKFDVRFAYVGAAAGFLLVLLRSDDVPAPSATSASV